MRLINLIDNCGQLLNIILKSPNSADRTAEKFFRDKRKIIGSKERQFISQIVFTSIRNLILLKNISTEFELNKYLKHPNIFIKGKEYSIYILIQILLAEYFHIEFDFIILDNIKYKENKYKKDEKTLSIIESICLDLSVIPNTDTIANYINKELSKNIIDCYSNLQNQSISITQNNKNYANDNTNIINLLENLYSFPKEFVNNLLITSKFINIDNIFDFVKSMNRPANTCIRVNTSIISVDKVSNILKEQDVENYTGKMSSSCIIIPVRRQLTALDIYKQGYFTIQDEASQLVGYCINPNHNDSILDACAGAGGKSLHLADLQNDNGHITATDIEFTKLKETSKRAALTNYKSIHITLANNIMNKKFDVVLVDAPCSGAGTIRRDPIKKYTILSKTLNKISKNQLKILTNYSKYVRQNGTLIYSTCSIFPQENELIIKQFLDNNPDFQPEPISPHLKKYEINIPMLNDKDFYLTMYPFVHNTDGFFIARMKRI